MHGNKTKYIYALSILIYERSICNPNFDGNSSILSIQISCGIIIVDGIEDQRVLNILEKQLIAQSIKGSYEAFCCGIVVSIYS